MAENRILILEGSQKLSLDNGRVSITSFDSDPVFVQPGDIAAIVVDSPQIVITAASLRALSEAGASVIVTNSSHLPIDMLPGARGGTRLLSRLVQQFGFYRSPEAESLWRLIVRNRIRGQAHLLEMYQKRGTRLLKRLSSRVRPGDPDNLEAQAAKVYWRELLEAPHLRRKKGAVDPVNAALNYGYAIVRSLFARSLVASGLNSVLGIAHRGEQNAFNLADDLMEPDRFIVEARVRALVEKGELREFDSPTRRLVASVISETVRHSDAEFRLSASIERVVSTFLGVIERGHVENFDACLPYFDKSR
jgi:CRISPR-associated protein Cas1